VGDEVGRQAPPVEMKMKVAALGVAGIAESIRMSGVPESMKRGKLKLDTENLNLTKFSKK
jgi:hypothetical protein